MDSRNFVFAHLADAHVGAWSRDPAVRRALRESVLRALSTVEERNCEFLLVCGDLFHTPVPEPGEVAPVAAKLRQLIAQGIRVYVIYGSHDYVAHRTSWLDVLAETGLFLRAAPEAVRAEGQRWTLPFLVDSRTGARIAGISGRSQGLDRAYFAAVDSEAFRAQPGFKIFQFHAAILEYLPPHLREHVQGVSREDLPGGCDYYAGGHIHLTYSGTGPEGGLLVNPGAVFGTSVPDVENGQLGRSNQGVVIVHVEGGVPHPEFVRTAPPGALEVFDVDVSGKTQEEARLRVAEALQSRARPGALLFPRVHGTLAEGSVSALGLHESTKRLGGLGVETVHWDIRDVSSPPVEGIDPGVPASSIESTALDELHRSSGAALVELSGPDGRRRIAELLHELGIPRMEGESKADYETARIDAALAILQVRRTDRAMPPD
jgi:DNA repair exonuclease SbcCD nuclease subunit